MSRTALRAGGAFGIAHVVLLMTGFALVASEDALMESPANGITAYFVDGPMTKILTGGYLEVLGALCFLPFAVALARWLRDRGGDAVASSTVVAAAVVYVTLTLSPGLAAGGAAVWLGHHGTTDVDVLRGLVALRTFTYFTSLIVLGLVLGAVAVTVLSRRGMPRWIGVSAAVLGAALPVGVALQQAGIAEIVSLLSLVWVVAVSIGLLRDNRPADEPARTAVPAV